MFDPIQLTPGAEERATTTSINDNFRKLEQESRRKTYKDKDGVNRILIGQTLAGDAIIAHTVKGVDVIEALGES